MELNIKKANQGEDITLPNTLVLRTDPEVQVVDNAKSWRLTLKKRGDITDDIIVEQIDVLSKPGNATVTFTPALPNNDDDTTTDTITAGDLVVEVTSSTPWSPTGININLSDQNAADNVFTKLVVERAETDSPAAADYTYVTEIRISGYAANDAIINFTVGLPKYCHFEATSNDATPELRKGVNVDTVQWFKTDRQSEVPHIMNYASYNAMMNDFNNGVIDHSTFIYVSDASDDPNYTAGSVLYVALPTFNKVVPVKPVNGGIAVDQEEW